MTAGVVLEATTVARVVGVATTTGVVEVVEGWGAT